MLKAAFGASACAAVASWAYLRHIMLSTGPDRLGWSQQVFAHRGCRFIEGIPENTVPAFEYAALNCASGIECDVRLTAEGQLAVFHDAVLGNHVVPPQPNTRVSSLTLGELQALELREDTKGQAVQLPSLEDVISVGMEHDLRMLIELKPTFGLSKREVNMLVDAMLETFQRHEDFLYDQATVISFDPYVLYRLRLKEPRIAVVVLSIPNYVSTAMSGGGDSTAAATGVKIPAIAKAMPWLADRVLHFALHGIAPWVVGASGIGVPYSAYEQQEFLVWNHRRQLVYLWGYTSPDHCTASMRSNGIAVAADRDFGQYFMRPRYPFQAGSVPAVSSGGQGNSAQKVEEEA